jgi:hypothetical protein
MAFHNPAQVGIELPKGRKGSINGQEIGFQRIGLPPNSAQSAQTPRPPPGIFPGQLSGSDEQG